MPSHPHALAPICPRTHMPSHPRPRTTLRMPLAALATSTLPACQQLRRIGAGMSPHPIPYTETVSSATAPPSPQTARLAASGKGRTTRLGEIAGKKQKHT
eukprot:359653-Chlamydomonas_euryale.AAC.1